jgi:septal ring factor EnvC (AmiA/AmiB activator)
MDVQENQNAQGLSSADIWAMFRETALQFKETERLFKEADRRMAETDRLIKEAALESKAEAERRMAEIDRRIAETDRQMAETDRKMAETDRKISSLGSRIGELIENLVASNLLKKFTDRGYVFTKTCPNVILTKADRSFLAEIDILLENGDTALAVEVKSKLTIKDVKEHLHRMKRLRRYADERGDRRKFLGAVAAGIIPKGVKPFAIKSGFFVIEQSGDTAVIAVPEGFVPREW